MKKIFSVVSLSAYLFSTPALAYFYTGNDLYEWGAALQRTRDNRHLASDTADASMYQGYVSGIYDSANGVVFCPKRKQGMTIGQISDVVFKYLKDNPESRNESASQLVMSAFVAAFPCQKEMKIVLPPISTILPPLPKN
ncbi:Rap1a/Tai family immunity protein [Rahnella contaminans]|uniref:Rap1a/Tai family immunity protein n=1 Tax=Rahnella contaminans TaxID=2703882 RepID=UPI0023D99F2F|nr:Rap1a/Tai family immunity protein [Rahnella contaminans]MDF1895552.1 Rap1a/Tai family immunity protein [Rahnella contaminans]